MLIIVSLFSSVYADYYNILIDDSEINPTALPDKDLVILPEQYLSTNTNAVSDNSTNKTISEKHFYDRIAFQALSGTAITGLGFGTGYLIAQAAHRASTSGDDGESGIAAVPAFAITPFLVGLSTYYIGKSFETESGSWGGSIGGAYLGFIGGFSAAVVVSAATSKDGTYNTSTPYVVIPWILMAAGTVSGSIIGYEITRVETNNGEIVSANGKFNIPIPFILIKTKSDFYGKTITENFIYVNLFSNSF